MSGVSRRAFPATAAALLWWLVAAPTRGQRGYASASLKAAMIQKIAAFVRWPSGAARAGATALFVLTVLGDDELSARLRFLYEGQRIDGREVRVIASDDPALLSDCDALFIGARFADALEQVLRSLARRPVLTLGDTPGFAERGVDVNLFVDNHRRLRFEVNRHAMESRGLKPSYQLLSFAKLVADATGGGAR